MGFAAIPLLNSYLFQLNVFDMGLTDRELKKFGTKRVYSIVLMENLPQIVLQTWFLLLSSDNGSNLIAISSMVLSLISIIVSIMPWHCSEQSILRKAMQ